MNTFEIGVTLLFVAVFFIGLRATWRQWRRYRKTTPILTEPRAYLVIGSFFVVSATITGAAGFFGWLSVRRLLGFEPLPEAALVSTVIATIVLLIPAFLDGVASRIESGPR